MSTGALAGLIVGILSVSPQRLVAEESAASVESGEAEAFFEEHVQPILKAHCVKCHGGRTRVKGGLRLTSRADLLKGGDLGPAVSLEKPATSLILKAIDYEDENLQMPPAGRLDQAKIDVLTRWVKMKAPWGATSTESIPTESRQSSPQVTAEAMRFWSFLPVERPAVPAVKNADWVKNPIDAFVLHRLEESGLEPAPHARPRELLRRATYGVTGLPPTPASVDAFVVERSLSYEEVVDQLLASPQYGESWARDWLDLVRYAETNSFERDRAKPDVWRYRDYVIDSLNSDKPYDQFVREQLAGDELDEVTNETLIATGYYRLGAWDDESTDPLQSRYDDLDDVVATTGQVFLGLTVNCARCHDHKLDPIPQRDYYRLLAFFHGIRPYSYQHEKSVLVSISPPEVQKKYYADVKALKEQTEAAKHAVERVQNGVISLLSSDEQKQTSDHAKRAALLEKKVPEFLTPDAVARYKELVKEFQRLNATKIPRLDYALCVKEEKATPPETFIFTRGNAHVPADKVEPGFPAVLNTPDPVMPAPAKDAKSSGRRRVLADWIASPKNPLTARVIVNRVWKHHFGRGIVRTPSNFGRLGARPTHPELLDWLASEFMANGWRLKYLHKLIMTSSTYRMSSAGNTRALEIDPENDLLWRVDMRRLGAEEIRDSILAVNGKLNPKMGGPSIFTIVPKEILAGQSRPGDGWTPSRPEERARRSIYIHIKRSLIAPFLASFDFADTDTTCPVRFATTQATQALTMLNSEFMDREAAAFALRLKDEAGDSSAARVRLAFRLALAREAQSHEVERGVALMAALEAEKDFGEDEAVKQFCLLVLNLNEFIYLD
ncbi:MAG: PSD1 and planctomycete cytochrome C domain-containing protein [Planctomycetes bacterium]|nr:PSD1 and planctomycete cytochrome C domain-containing protein [Planctomycetota bacterium]